MNIIKKIFTKEIKDLNLTNNSRLNNNIITQRGNLDSLFPSDFTKLEIELIEAVNNYTMTSPERLVSLSRAIEYIETQNIKGDIVECGVWKGGSMMLIAQKLKLLKNTNRKLYLFDTFEGMVKPSESDIDILNRSAVDLYINENEKFSGDNEWCFSSLSDVKANLVKTEYPQDNLIFVKGPVEKTLPHKNISKIALLRLDTDWYESTKHELETLYDKLEIGGILIIDDYGHWNGARKAVDEFILKNKLNLFLNRVDYTCRMAIKTN
jgi:hypothetical protein